MKAKYENAILDVIAFSSENVVTSSGGNGNETEEGDP